MAHSPDQNNLLPQQRSEFIPHRVSPDRLLRHRQTGALKPWCRVPFSDPMHFVINGSDPHAGMDREYTQAVVDWLSYGKPMDTFEAFKILDRPSSTDHRSLQLRAGISPRCHHPAIAGIGAAVADQHHGEHVHRLRLQRFQSGELYRFFAASQLTGEGHWGVV